MSKRRAIVQAHRSLTFSAGIATASSTTTLGSSHCRETVAWMRRSFRSFIARSQMACRSQPFSTRGLPAIGRPAHRFSTSYRVKPSSRPGAATEPTHPQERAKVVSSSRDSVLTRRAADLDRTLQPPIDISMPRHSLMTMRHRGPICRRSLSYTALESSISQRELTDIIVGTAFARRLRMRSNTHCAM
jgi:hypothetical protein